MRTIPQGELRNQSGEILRETPKRRWVPRAEVMTLLAGGKPDPGYFQDIAELGTLDDLTDPWSRTSRRSDGRSADAG